MKLYVQIMYAVLLKTKNSVHRNGREGSATICGPFQPRRVCACEPQENGTATSVQKPAHVYVYSQEKLR